MCKYFWYETFLRSQKFKTGINIHLPVFIYLFIYLFKDSPKDVLVTEGGLHQMERTERTKIT